LAELLDSIDEPGYLMAFESPFWVIDYAPLLGMAILLAMISPAIHLPQNFLGLFLNKAKVQNKVKTANMEQNSNELTRFQHSSSTLALQYRAEPTIV
jgi:hypothetical protein